MTIAVDLGRKANKQTNKHEIIQVTRCIDFEEANSQVDSLCGALPNA